MEDEMEDGGVRRLSSVQVRTYLPEPLDVNCTGSDASGVIRTAMKYCNFIPGNSIYFTAGEFHSGFVSMGNRTSRDPSMTDERRRRGEEWRGRWKCVSRGGDL